MSVAAEVQPILFHIQFTADSEFHRRRGMQLVRDWVRSGMSADEIEDKLAALFQTDQVQVETEFDEDDGAIYLDVLIAP